jgi:hypothetical protein
LIEKLQFQLREVISERDNVKKSLDEEILNNSVLSRGMCSFKEIFRIESNKAVEQRMKVGGAVRSRKSCFYRLAEA